MIKELMQEILPNQAQSDVLEGATRSGKSDVEIPEEGPNEEPKPAPARDTREAPSEVPPVGEHVPEHRPDSARL